METAIFNRFYWVYDCACILNADDDDNANDATAAAVADDDHRHKSEIKRRHYNRKML